MAAQSGLRVIWSETPKTSFHVTRLISGEENELEHDKTNKMTCAPNKDSDQHARHPPSLISLSCQHEGMLMPWLPIKRAGRVVRIGRSECTGHFANFIMLQLKFQMMGWAMFFGACSSFLFPHSKIASKIVEPRHDKTNKMSVHPVKTQISLGIHPV